MRQIYVENREWGVGSGEWGVGKRDFQDKLIII
jgi:hypothetical protein